MPRATPEAASIAARPGRPPSVPADMTLSLPPWLSACSAAMSGHPPTIPAELALDPAQRREVACCLAELDERLRPASAREAGERFTALLLAFPAQASGETAAKLRAAAYFEALAGEPAWAISRACGRWLRGEVQEAAPGGGASSGATFAGLAFAPSPPQLRLLCAAETLPVRRQAARLARLLEAEPAGTRAPDMPAERRAALAERLSALARSLGGGDVRSLGGGDIRSPGGGDIRSLGGGNVSSPRGARSPG